MDTAHSFLRILVLIYHLLQANNQYHVTVKNAIRNGSGPSPSDPPPDPTVAPSPTVVPTSMTHSTTLHHTMTTKSTIHTTTSASAPITVLPTTTSVIDDAVPSPSKDPRATARVKRPMDWTFGRRRNPAIMEEARSPLPKLRNSRFFKF